MSATRYSRRLGTWIAALCLLSCGHPPRRAETGESATAPTAPTAPTALKASTGPAAPTAQAEPAGGTAGSGGTALAPTTAETPVAEEPVPQEEVVPPPEEPPPESSNPAELGRVEGIRATLSDGSYILFPYTDHGLDVCLAVVVAVDGTRTPHRPPHLRHECAKKWAKQDAGKAD